MRFRNGGSVDNQLIGVFGRKRQGKTRWMLHYLRQRIKDQKNVGIVYVDYKGGEYDFGVEVITYSSIESCVASMPFTARVPAQTEETFDWLCEKALEVASREVSKEKDNGSIIVAVDEAQHFSNKHHNSDGFEMLQDNGGMYGLDIIFTTHRPGDIHGNLKAACDRMIIFQTHHTRDIDLFQDYIDVPAEAFKMLGKGDYLEWNIEDGYRIVKKNVTSRWVRPGGGELML